MNKEVFGLLSSTKYRESQMYCSIDEKVSTFKFGGIYIYTQEMTKFEFTIMRFYEVRWKSH